MKPKFSVVDGGKGKSRAATSATSATSPASSPRESRIGYRKKIPFSSRVGAQEDPHAIDTYIVASTDNQGHSVTVGACIPPYLKRTADVVLTKGRFGFKTMGDLVRWCVKHGLESLGDISRDPEITTAYDAIRPLLRSQSIELARREYEQYLIGTKIQFDNLIKDGNIETVYKLRDEIETYVNNAHVPEHWRKRWRLLFVDRYNWIEKRIREREEGLDE